MNTVVVPKEQWEAADRVLVEWARTVENYYRNRCRPMAPVYERELLARIATALLGGKVYRATAVGTLQAASAIIKGYGVYGKQRLMARDDDIAIVEKEDTNA